MTGHRLLVGLLLAASLAGCVQPGTTSTPLAVESAAQASWFSWNGASRDAATGVGFPMGTGQELKLEFEVGWSHELRSGDLVLEASVDWSKDDSARPISIWLEDASGGLLASGRLGWYSAVALLPDPQPGTYVLRASGPSGSSAPNSDYHVFLQLEDRSHDGPAADMLPNLVAVPPDDLQIMACQVDEAIEQQAKRCLRFSTFAGNIGTGPLEVHLTLDQAALGVAGQGHYTQRILRTDGSSRYVDAGPANLHPIHGHFHYAGLAHMMVYRYDWEARERADEFSPGRKAGFCFLDSGLVAMGLPFTAERTYDGSGCLLADKEHPDEGLYQGVSANWYDHYYPGLSGQYVDMEGAEDGVYELEITSNALFTLTETTKHDNTARVVFRLTGDDVDILDPAA